MFEKLVIKLLLSILILNNQNFKSEDDAEKWSKYAADAMNEANEFLKK